MGTPHVASVEPEAPQRLGVPREVVLLGVVSFLTDVSSEAIFAVLPLFLTSVLGASTVLLGAMEGFSDFAASSLDMASGYLSDRLGKRKSLAVVGYGLSSVAKLVLLVATTAGQVFAFRVVERLGKSIRGAPRDALLSGLGPKEKRGTSFGVHKAFDKAGAILGPLLAYAILSKVGETAEGFHTLFLAAVIPGFASVAVLIFFVREHPGPGRQRVPLREALRTLGPGYRHYLVSAGLFSLAYFSFAFLMLAAARVGFELKDVVVALFLLYGVFYAIDEGQSKAYLADLTPEASRATAIGTYGFVTALVYLPASLLAGLLWSSAGPAVTFGVGAGLALLALGHFLLFGPKEGPRPLAG